VTLLIHHPHPQGDESDGAEAMDDTPPDFTPQEFLNDNVPPPVANGAVGVELGGANLVVQPHKVCR
jgi:hypothetical protein